VIWLLWHRLWLALIGWIVVMLAIQFGCALGASRGTIFCVDVLIALLMGFEAASLRRWTVSRRKWRQLDVVVADDEETAERRSSIDGRPDNAMPATTSPAVDRARRRRRGNPGPAVFRPPSAPRSDIIGLFPQPGTSRERCHYRLRLGKSALRCKSVRARGAEPGESGKDRGHA
jgi:hypothetical protein